VSVEPRIGLLVGREWSFPPAFIDAVAKRQAGVTADYITLDVTQMAQPVPYTLIIDRISHEVGFYRAFLKHATRMGVTVVNNPFIVVIGRQVLRCHGGDSERRRAPEDDVAAKQGLHPRDFAFRVAAQTWRILSTGEASPSTSDSRVC
jgi:hypothetical protein